ncbi:MAG: M24 family metallopeptidase, partial [Anaerolineaceae bacterium]|nr:M24 family metallopeptidase [Anaerolineaceae bacterium]
PPEPVSRAVTLVAETIQSVVLKIKPGVICTDLDRYARELFSKAGFPEFKHALGHQLGRMAHDGGSIIGPEWKRYGNTINQPIEVNQVYTIEPSIFLEEFGIIGLEENILVTVTGAEFLTTPQTEIIVRL